MQRSGSAPQSQQQYNPSMGTQGASQSRSTSFLEWRVDQVTGVPYQVLVQPACPQYAPGQGALGAQQQYTPRQDALGAQQQPAALHTAKSPMMSGQSAESDSASGSSTMAQQLKERMAGIVSLVESGGERQAKQLKLLNSIRKLHWTT